MKEVSFAANGLSRHAAAGVLRSLREKKYCDFNLVCQGQIIPVHKAVVCAQSQVFAKICSERYQKKSQTSYEIHDADIQTVMLMVQYLYTGKHAYTLEQPGSLHDIVLSISETRRVDNPDYIRNKTSFVATLLAHIKLLDLAETYLIDELVSQLVDEFREVLSRPDYGYCFMALLEIIPRIYELQTSAGNLLRRECVTAIIASFGPWLTAHGSHRQALDELLVTVPQFSKDLLEAFITTEQPQARKQDDASKSRILDQ